jgi:N-acetylglucosamine-6-phosphate deacetylase
MSKFLVKNANIITKTGILENHSVLCDADKITQIGPDGDFAKESAIDIIDAGGKYLAPGFIDLHSHGLCTYLIDNGPDDLANMCKLLPQYGVTGFLPTVCPLPKGRDAEFIKSLSEVKSQGAQILGFHLEGPFLTLTGALPPEALGNADPERVKALIAAASPYNAIFSIAPDFEDIEELIGLMAQNNTPVFITHTKANVKQTQIAIDSGARHATHFYDVFPCPAESDPGVRHCGAVEAILAERKVSVDFILDGEHVDPIAVKMALQCKGADKVCLITDANIGAGSEPGKYKFGKEEIEFAYPGSPARGTENSRFPGGLYGSGLTMNRAVKNAVEMLGVDLPLAVKMASDNPARVLGLENTGKIEVGKQADIVLINEKFEVRQTWIGGKCCYKA